MSSKQLDIDRTCCLIRQVGPERPVNAINVGSPCFIESNFSGDSEDNEVLVRAYLPFVNDIRIYSRRSSR